MVCPSTKEKASVRVAWACDVRAPGVGTARKGLLRVAGACYAWADQPATKEAGVAGAGTIIYIYHLLAL